jgi:hypothetical protein
LYYPARAEVKTRASAKGNNLLCRLECRPQKIGPGDEAQGASDEHPDPGDDVDAALGDGADPPFLAPTPAQQGVGTKNEARYAGEREQEAEGQDGGHMSLAFSPGAHHAGEEGAEAGIGAQRGELQGAREVLHVALAGVYGLLDVVQRVAEVAAASPDAGER